MPTAKLSSTHLRVSRRQRTLDGGTANLGREWAARITPSLAATERAPEITRSGVLCSLQMHLSCGVYTSLLGRRYSGTGAGGG